MLQLLLYLIYLCCFIFTYLILSDIYNLLYLQNLYEKIIMNCLNAQKINKKL